MGEVPWKGGEGFLPSQSLRDSSPNVGAKTLIRHGSAIGSRKFDVDCRTSDHGSFYLCASQDRYRADTQWSIDYTPAVHALAVHPADLALDGTGGNALDDVLLAEDVH